MRQDKRLKTNIGEVLSHLKLKKVYNFEVRTNLTKLLSFAKLKIYYKFYLNLAF